jgi:hypothetical protein|nr:hypothetical protein [Neorhizobium tomejilense]
MSKFELKFEISANAGKSGALMGAVRKAGYADALVTLDEGMVSVIVEHEDARFSRGHLIADDILECLPACSKLVSVKQAMAVWELSEEDLVEILGTQP